MIALVAISLSSFTQSPFMIYQPVLSANQSNQSERQTTIVTGHVKKITCLSKLSNILIYN